MQRPVLRVYTPVKDFFKLTDAVVKIQTLRLLYEEAVNNTKQTSVKMCNLQLKENNTLHAPPHTSLQVAFNNMGN